nr:MAG TPA: hypothetical protein [Caudoviricetes sp.]
MEQETIISIKTFLLIPLYALALLTVLVMYPTQIPVI